MSEPGAVKQSKLLANFPPAERKQVRESTLASHDWYKEGNTIWIRPSGIRKFAIKEEEPGLGNVMVELRALHPLPNRRYIACALRGKSGKVACLLPLKIKAERLCGQPYTQHGVTKYKRGKLFKAEEIVLENGEKAYRHEWLSEYEKPRSERKPPEA